MACFTQTATFDGPFDDVEALRALLREFSERYANLDVEQSAVIGKANPDVLVVRGVSRARVKELAARVDELRAVGDELAGTAS